MPDSLENATIDEVLDHVGPGKLIRSDVFTWMLERIRELEDRIGEGDGGGRVTVPNFAGLPLGSAVDALGQTDLMLQRGPTLDAAGQTLNTSDAANRPRIVISHSPEAGRRVAPGSAIRLVVAAPVSSGGGNGGDGGTPVPAIEGIDPSEQNIGDEVTINGENFLGTTVTVTIDGENATINRLTDIAIDARIPETVTEPPADETRTVPVTVTVDGESVTVNDALSVSPMPPEPKPIITGVEPSSATSGDTVTISGDNFTDDAGAVNVVFTFASADISAQVLSAQTNEAEPDEIEIEVPDISVGAAQIIPFRVEIDDAPVSDPFSQLIIEPS